MADERHTEDTLFFIAEEDWRCFEEDALDGAGVQAIHMKPSELVSIEVPQDVDAAVAARKKSKAWHQAEVAPAEEQVSSQPPADMEEVGPGWFCRTTKPARSVFSDVSPELIDMVKLCNVASRHEAGGLVWLSWNPNVGDTRYRNDALKFGSQLIAVSAWAARLMLKNFDDWFPRYHWDCTLKSSLESREDIRMSLQPSFVRPSIGQFEPHVSGCSNVGVRQPKWQAKHVQSGTRTNAPTDVHRSICGFTKQGVVPVIVECVEIPEPPGADYNWYTSMLPDDQSGGVAAAAAASSSDFAKQQQDNVDDYGYPGMDDHRKRICKVFHFPGTPKRPETDSQSRLLRARINDYERRLFLRAGHPRALAVICPGSGSSILRGRPSFPLGFP